MLKYKHLTSAQRYEIFALLANKISQRQIALTLNVSESTISREIKRNKNQRGHYSAAIAIENTKIRSMRSCNHRIRHAVRKRVLSLLVTEQWSPQQISGYLRREDIRISHETIYQWIRADKRAGGTLYTHCRHRLKHRKRFVGKARNIPHRVSIHERPPEADGKRFGDWEMDTIIGKGGSGVIVTLVERKTNYMLMSRLPKGKNAKELAQVVERLLFPFHKNVHTITTDNGSEFCEHERIAKYLKTKIYFADPYSSWQKGCIENTNKLIRQYIPKNMNFNDITDEYIKKVQQTINKRPRKKLNFLTPIFVFSKYLY